MSSSWQFQLSSHSSRFPLYSSPLFSSTVTVWPDDSWRSFTGIPKLRLISSLLGFSKELCDSQKKTLIWTLRRLSVSLQQPRRRGDLLTSLLLNLLILWAQTIKFVSAQWLIRPINWMCFFFFWSANGYISYYYYYYLLNTPKFKPYIIIPLNL